MIDVGVGERTGRVPAPVLSDLGAALVAVLAAMLAVLLAYDPNGTAAPGAPIPAAAVPDVVSPPTAPADPGRSLGTSESLVLDRPDPRSARPLTGFSSAPLLDANGRLWVAYIDESRDQVVVGVCADASCRSVERSHLAEGRRLPFGLDVALTPGGVVATYLELDPRDPDLLPREQRLVLASCTAGCGAVEHTVLAERLPRTTATAVAVDADGRPRVAFRGTDGELHLLACVDPACVRSTTQVLTSSGVGDHVDLALTPSGDAVVTSRSAASGGLQVTICGDADCATRATHAVGGERGGQRSSLTLTPAGEILVAHKFADGLELVWCGTDCAAPRRQVIADGFGAGSFPTVRLDDGAPVVAYYDEAERAPVVTRCVDADCTSHTRAIVDDRGTAGEHLGLALARDGSPLLTYHDREGGLLRLTRCASPGCGSAQPLSATDIDVVATAAGPVVVFRDPSGDVVAVRCSLDDCDGVPASLDLDGTAPAEAVAAVDRDGTLLVATRAPGATAAAIHACGEVCTAVASLPAVSRLLALHPTAGGELEAIHVDPTGSIRVARCTEVCGRGRLLGTPGSHAVVVAASRPEVTAVSWRERSSDDVWMVRCERSCAAAPMVVGTWPGGGAIELTMSADGTAMLAVELADVDRTELWACATDRCRRRGSAVGRPLSLVSDGSAVGLLVADGSATSLLRCEDGCAATETHLDAGLMTPTVVGTSPLLVVGRDRSTMEVVTLACDERGCSSVGFDVGTSAGPGVQ